MILLALLLQLALCLVILRQEVLRRHCRNFASSIFFSVYAIVYVVEPLVLHLFFGGATTIVAGSDAQFDDPAVYYLFQAYGLSLLVTWLLFGRTGERELAADPVKPARRDDGIRFGYLTALLVVGAVLFIHSSGMSLADLLVAARFAWVDAAGFSPLGLNLSGYCIGVAATWAFAARREPKVSRALLLVGLGALLLNGLLTKDRKWIIYLLSGVAAGSFERQGRTLRIPPSSLVWLGVIFAFLVISQFVRDVVFRYAIGEQLILGQEFARRATVLVETGDISYFYRASLEALHQNMHNGLLVPFALPRRILFFFLPSSWSGGLKVEDISAIFSDVVHGEDLVRRGSMPPGLFGLLVISFGWFASLFLVPCLAFGLKRLDRWFRTGTGTIRAVALSMFGFVVVMGFRGDESSAWYFPAGTLVLVALGRLVWGRTRPAPAKAALSGGATQ